MDDDALLSLLLLAFGLKLPNPAAAAPLALLLIPAAAGGVAALPKDGLVVGKVLPAPFAADAVEGVVLAVLPKGGELLLLVNHPVAPPVVVAVAALVLVLLAYW